MVQLPEIEYLINNYFPNLKNVTINTTWHKEKDSFAYITGNRFKGFNIAFSKKDYTSLKRKVILGVLSHELAHIEYDLRYNFFVTLIKNFLFKFNTRYETKI